jgi:8-amino-7-oxononanoate synthase/dethiobiotin synthase
MAISSAQEPEVTIDGRRVILLCSNNYLGLAADPRVRAAASEAALRWGAGSGASRLVSGTTDLHLELERALAAHKSCEASILFSSGYLANVGTIATLVGSGDVVFSDELNHASIIDGCRLSGAARVVYRHADAADLERGLASSNARRRLVVTDTVFSMDGDLAPLQQIVELCERYDAMLMVDEAHATGVLGSRGAGAVAASALAGRVPVVMGTLSKSLGSAGGFVAGSVDLIELLRNRARAHVFDTAPAPPAVGAAARALEISIRESWRGERARELAGRLSRGLRDLGYDACEPAAAVVPVMVGEPGEAVELSRRLLEQGVFVPAIRPPSVPPGTARLRVTTMATHTDDHLARVLDAFSLVRSGRPARPAAVLPRPAPRSVFVTGTDTGVGKTVVAAALASLWSRAGRRVGLMKPAQTGVRAGADDARFVVSLAGLNAEDIVVGYELDEALAPSVAARLESVEVDPSALLARLTALRARTEAVLVEGAGGLLVQLAEGYCMADLARDARLPVLVVARPGLGTINHTALTVQAARSRDIEVAGVVICDFPDDPGLAEATNPSEIEAASGAEIAGVVPHLEGVDVDRLRFPAAIDPRPWFGPALGGTFDRELFLRSLEIRRMHAPA